MKLAKMRSLLLVGIIVSLVLVNVTNGQENDIEDSANQAGITEDVTEGGDETDANLVVNDSSEANDLGGATAAGEEKAASGDEGATAAEAAAVPEATAAGAEEAATKSDVDEAAGAGETSSKDVEQPAVPADSKEKDAAPAGTAADFDAEKATEASDYGFGVTHDDDHATSDGTAEVAAESNNTPSSDDGTTGGAAAGEAAAESTGEAGVTPGSEDAAATDADKQSGDGMATDKDEETSGDAEHGVTIGGEKDPSLIPVCAEDEFQCDSKCFSKSKMCDQKKDCADGRDESSCPGTDAELSLQVSPDQETFNVRAGETLEFTCSARGPFPTIQVLVYKDQVPVDQSDSRSVQIRKENAQPSDGGQYICYAFPPDRSSYVVKSINVVIEGGAGGVRPARPPTGAKTIDAKVDTNVVLECSLSAEENSNAKWKKLTGKMSEYIQEYYGKLYIYYLKLDDSGEYECQSADGRRDKVYLRVYDGDRPPAPEERPTDPSTDPSGYKYAVRAYVQETTIRFRNGQTVEQECNAMTNGNNMEIEWYNQRQQLIRNDGKHTITTNTAAQTPLNKISKLTITNVNQADSGYYECRVRVEGQRESVRFELQPEQPSGTVCAIEEATCRNGQCIPRSGLCDGRMDCSDGSDEVNCGGSSSGRCEPNEKQCRNSKCIQKIWYCDGENDCGDNSDEDQCPEPRPGEICKTHEFLCRNGQQCVLKGFVCDGEYDCLDQSDESGCEKPSIVRGPIRNMTVYLGRTIRVECEASGFPAPFINWRLNWGHVCEEPRCTITNENGKGVLTINNARLEDAGAYSCEALNSKGRVFAVPDAIVYVLSQPGDRPLEPDVVPRKICNPIGSYNTNPPCFCRPGWTGFYCDDVPFVEAAAPAIQCNESFFALHVPNRKALCAPCFCNGLGVACAQSQLYYTKVESKFTESDDGWRVDNKFGNLSTSVDLKQEGLRFAEFEDFPGEDLFFYAPAKYLGNKLTSYGGNLTFGIRYEGPSSGRPKRIEVRIAGARVNLVHRVNRIFYPYYDYTVNIPLTQEEFRRFGDNGRVNREHMLMALSNIQTIMIRASYSEHQYAVLLKQVSMDFGEPYPTSRSDKPASGVEKCACPLGYSGTSCESCASGYKRAQGGSYLGLCEESNEVTIDVDAPNKKLELRVGETRIVKTTLSGPNVENEPVRWSREPESYLPYGVSQQGNNLVFSNAEPSMAGTYTATVYTPQGLVKETLTVTVLRPTGSREPPSIYSPNQRTISLDVGERFSLECIARGDPLPSIRIQSPDVRRGDPNIQQVSNLQTRPGTQPQAKIDLSYFTEDNAGTYICIAENSFGEQAVERFEVSVRRDTRDPPTISIEPKQVEAFEGQALNVNFTYTGAEPVQFKVQQYSAEPQPSSGINVNRANKKIEIARVTKDMQGQYVVEASNDYGTYSDYFTIIVNDAPGPKIMVTDTVIRTDVGTVLKIEPKVQYSGRPQFTWTKDGRPLPANVQVLGYVLYVPYVTKENQGLYTLTLVDDYGTAKIQVTIIVDDRVSIAPAPTNPNRIIVKQDMDVDLNQGQNANLVCQIQPRAYNPRVITTTSWVKGMREQRERFPSNIRPNQERLQILKVKPSDAGMYTCVTISSDGSTQTAVVNIRVREGGASSGESSGEQRPPQPSQPPTAQLDTREKNVQVGSSLDLTCTVTGSPTPRVQWYYNNQPIEDVLADEILVSAVPGRYTLTIRNARQDLNGYVTCRATSLSDGQTAEDSAIVRAIPRSEPAGGDQEIQVDVDPREARGLRVGETTRLVCRVRDPRATEFSWNKVGGQLPGGSDGERSDVLTLFNLQELDSGEYVCTARDPQSGASGRGSSRVSVGSSSGEVVESGEGAGSGEQQPQQPSEPLKVEVLPKEATLVQGRDGEFVCNVQGGSGAASSRVVSWKKTSEQLDPERHQVIGNRLVIKNAQMNDRGYFECEVQSGDEVLRDYTRVEIESREAPKIEIYPNEEQVELDVGGTVYAQCRVVAGIPTPTVEWRRVDRRPLSSKAVVSQEGSLLQITDASRDEMGAYECVAKNLEGEATLKINIVQRPGQSGSGEEQQPQQPEDRPPYPPNRGDEEDAPSQPTRRPHQDEDAPPDVQILTPVVQVADGETVNLKCQTGSAPPFRIDWSGPSGDYLGSTEDGSFTIPNARSSDSGTYTCTVTNRNGNRAGSAQVTVGDGRPSQPTNENDNYNYPPQQPEQERLRVQVTPKSKTVTVGSQTEFNCQVDSSSRASSEPIIRWSRAGGLPLPQYHQTRGNQLILYNIEANDAGRYQCTAQSADGSIEFDAAYLQVSKVDPTSPFPVYIRVREAPTDSFDSLPSFRYGVRLTVECVAQTSDIDSIVWSKEEGVSRASYERVSDAENHMIIAALLPMDLGNYVCIARRNNGEKAQNSIDFRRHPQHSNLFTYDVKGASGPVDEQQPHQGGHNEHENNDHHNQHPQQPDSSADSASEPPRLAIIGSKQLTLNEGASAEIRCEVIGTSVAELSKHGGELPVSHRITKSGNVHILSMSNLKEADSGYYLCNAQNSQGPARDYVYVQVNRADDRDSRGPQQPDDQDQQQPQQPDQRPSSKPLVSIRALTGGKPIALGQELRLACYVDDADAQIDFARADGRSPDERRVRVESVNPGVRELVIAGFEASDAGAYRCTASNRAGRASDVGHVEAEADNTFTFKTDKHNDVEVSPGNPHVTIRAADLPRDNAPLDVECRLVEDNGIPANSYSWSKYPSLPRTARVDHNRLNIQRFETNDNGLYTCRASTDENDYEKTKLIASNDYLLGPNPFFRISKADDGIEVKCRPESEFSTYTWRAGDSSHNDENSYRIDGDRLVIYQSAAAHPHTFACALNTDSEFGPISIELDVNSELVQRALGGGQQQQQQQQEESEPQQPAQSGEENNQEADNQEAPARLYVEEHRDDQNSYIECQPGEDC